MGWLRRGRPQVRGMPGPACCSKPDPAREPPGDVQPATVRRSTTIPECPHRSLVTPFTLRTPACDCEGDDLWISEGFPPSAWGHHHPSGPGLPSAFMRQLLPEADDDVDPIERYAADARPAL